MKKSVVIIVLVLIAMAAGAFWLMQPHGPHPSAEQPQSAPATGTSPKNGDETSDQATAKPESAPDTSTRAQSAPPTKTEAKTAGFCERDFGDSAEREADAAALQAQGGLVHIFEREGKLADPYGCADFYLAHGLNVNAVDPRADHAPLTGLHFAIKRNDPRMLRFMIDHGADLKKRAGRKDVKPMGYAYFLAFNDSRINRNEIIGILDAALTRQHGKQDKD